MWNLLDITLKNHYQHSWQPAADVYRWSLGWLVKLDLAGIQIEDIKICVKCHRLLVSGIRKDQTINNVKKPYAMEIAYNRFERIVDLPCNIDHAHIDMDYRDGMLLVRLQLESLG